MKRNSPNLILTLHRVCTGLALTSFLLLPLEAISQDNSEKRSLRKILFQLEEAYRLSFNYDDETIRNIQLKEDFQWSKDESPDVVLERLLDRLQLKFERLDDKNYLILTVESHRSRFKEKTATPIRDQDPNSTEQIPDKEISRQMMPGDLVRVKGTVKEENGDLLPGVNVLVKGTTSGTTTDANGAFRIDAAARDAVLVFSFVGYASQEIPVDHRTIADIVLVPDVQSLKEVVVTGYNGMDKKDITGSVVTVKMDELKRTPANNFAQQLQGLVAGVVVSNDNSPGGGVAVRIRGIGSVTGSNDPLYIIDGVPTTGNLNQLNPNDIETMQVLKDAAAASIYGARANNGVILITTKKGKAGPVKISYNMYEGVQSPGKGPDLLNSQELVDIIWQDYKSRGLTRPDGTLTVPDPRFGGGARGVIPDYILSNGKGVMAGDPLIGKNPLSVYTNNIDDPAYNISKFTIYKPDKNGFDWYDATYNPAPIRNHNLNISGGSGQGRFAVSADYYQHTGIVINNSFKRYSLRANTEFNIKNIVRIGQNLQLSYTDGVGILLRDSFSPVRGFVTPPYVVPYDIGGNYVGHRIAADHSLSTLTRNKDNHGYTSRIFGNIYAEADLAKRLTVRTSLGVDYTIFDKQNFNPKSPESDLKPQVDVLTFEWSKSQNITWTNTINYQKEVGDHNFQLLAGTEAVIQQFRNVNANKSTLLFDTPSFQFFDAATQTGNLGGLGWESSLFSVFGKFDYKFRNRFLLGMTMRRDASSRFAPKNRWGTFPAFSGGWIVSEAPFLRNSTFVNYLKVRAGWGITGSQEIDPYNQFTTYAYSNANSSYPITGALSGAENLYPGYEVRRIGNPEAQWEQQSMVNAGIDMTLFGRLSVTAEMYKRVTSKLLLIAPAPGTAGQNAIAASNVGEVRNKGVDISATYEASPRSGFKYSVGVNWSMYKNNVSALYDASNPFVSGLLIREQIFTRTQVGQPLSSFYGMVNEGVFHSQEEADAAPTQFGNRSLYNQAGRMKYSDLSNDGVVNGEDVTFIGSPHPKFTYGLNATAGYSGMDFAMSVVGVYGNDIYNFERQGTDLMLYESNKTTRILDHWSPSNPDSNIPAPNQAASAEEYYRTSTFFVEKGSYLRLRSVQLGYTFRKSPGIEKIRLYLQANNMFTVTNYLGTDPEINVKDYEIRGNEIDRGVDRGVYPAAKTIMIGLQIGF